ncbi:MAG: iron-sulfur cluster repair di-iron protein [Actinomycetia bacterium]|nr:iron-sulfur cluster repair di-iron protein [Actinomycetes bacterium]
MPSTDPSTTLADLVTAQPALAADLDRLGLDFCCGGQRPLADAVADAGLDLEKVIAMIEATPEAPSDPGWEGMDGLVDHLETTHHAYLSDALPRLTALADKVAGVHGTNHPELTRVATLTAEIRSELEPHLIEEESVLFPMIRELATAAESPSFPYDALSNSIGGMLTEHDAAGALLAELRATTGGYAVPSDGCASYTLLYQGLAELEADTHVHIHKENNQLFPLVLEAEPGLVG